MCRPAPVAIILLSSVIIALVLGAIEHRLTDEPRVHYTITLDEPQTQMVSIALAIRDVEGEHIDFMLPIWRPGRYVVLNLAQSIRDFQALGDSDRPLAVEKTESATWRVMLDGSQSVRIEYRVYANSLGDRTRHVDDTHAFLSGSAVFMYAEAIRHEPCLITVNKPEHWAVACGLDPAPGRENTLHAANYDILIDSPFEIGVHQTIDFEAAGKPHQIVIWGEADAKPDELKRDFTKIVEAQTKVFGASPYDRYVFMIHAGAGASGGTEHINSTIMQTTRAALEETAAYQRFLNLVSHEFFHTWNIKAFRPAGLVPYAYQRANHTDLLWVVEGTTTYYAGLTLVRAGFTQPTRYLETLANSIDAMRNKPGETVQSVSEASFDSWIHWGNRTPDDVNSTVDFYGKGSLVSLLIDLEMRKRSQGKASLDDVMRTLYERFPLASGVGYTTDDLQRIIEELSGADFSDIFKRYVRAAEPLDFESAFQSVGVQLVFRSGGAAASGRGSRSPPPAAAAGDSDDNDEDDTQADGAATQRQPMRAYLGLNLTDGSGATAGRTTVTSILSDSPAFTSGILVGDEILAIDGRRITAGTLDARLRTCKPGQTITVTYFRREQLRTAEITLAAKPDGRWTLRKVRNPTDEQKAEYQAWLGQRW